jgi:hypothetical protein
LVANPTLVLQWQAGRTFIGFLVGFAHMWWSCVLWLLVWLPPGGPWNHTGFWLIHSIPVPIRQQIVIDFVNKVFHRTISLNDTSTSPNSIPQVITWLGMVTYQLLNSHLDLEWSHGKHRIQHQQGAKM